MHFSAMNVNVEIAPLKNCAKTALLYLVLVCVCVCVCVHVGVCACVHVLCKVI